MEHVVDHRSGPPQSDALQSVLAELGERIKPVSLAHERTLSLTPSLHQLVPGGLVRGQVVSCRGAGARSVAFGLVREALADGAWLAIVDVATFGTDAAAEFGVPLERVVRVETAADSTSGSDWIDVMGAAVDGFDLVLTQVPAELHDRRPAAVRKLRSRVHQKGAVVVTLGSPGALGGDIELETRRTVWTGLGNGSGRLDRRVVEVQASGRRMAERRSCAIEMIGSGTRVVMDVAVDRDPQAELLAEMADAVTVTDLNDRRLAG